MITFIYYDRSYQQYTECKYISSKFFYVEKIYSFLNGKTIFTKSKRTDYFFIKYVSDLASIGISDSLETGQNQFRFIDDLYYEGCDIEHKSTIFSYIDSVIDYFDD
jgi:hypothetical protein